MGEETSVAVHLHGSDVPEDGSPRGLRQRPRLRRILHSIHMADGQLMTTGAGTSARASQPRRKI